MGVSEEFEETGNCGCAAMLCNMGEFEARIVADDVAPCFRMDRDLVLDVRRLLGGDLFVRLFLDADLRLESTRPNKLARSLHGVHVLNEQVRR